MDTIEYISHSMEETIAIGAALGKELCAPCIVCFEGDLAAGKTTFIKGLVNSATGVSMNEVNSPTFVYLNIYEGTKTVYHFDLYRLSGSRDFMDMGFDEPLDTYICCLEWSERIEDILKNTNLNIKLISVSMHHLEDGKRKIIIEK